jgi:hypothetical protein
MLLARFQFAVGRADIEAISKDVLVAKGSLSPQDLAELRTAKLDAKKRMDDADADFGVEDPG